MTKDISSAFGLNESDTKNIKDITPSFPLGEMKVGDSVKFRVLEAEPRIIQYHDDEKDETVERPAIQVLDKLTGVTMTLWLNGKSLRQEFFKLHKQNSTLLDLDVIVSVREYQHDKWGKVRGYTVQVEKKVN